MLSIKIKLGYEVDSGKPIEINLSHMMVTGITQESGKTTTLESLAKRSNMRVVVFRTKGGEQSFTDGNNVKPFFKDRSDWQFIEGLIEATISEKVRAFERSMIIEICNKTNTLDGFKKEVDRILSTEKHNDKKIGNFQRSILINLQAYLKLVIPKLQEMKPSSKLVLSDKLNIIDLEKYDANSEVQSLIVKSVVEEILYTDAYMNTIVIIPESWKFIPQGKGNPAKFSIQKFIRQGAGTKRFLWIDSQDITGVDKETIKQVTTYLMGYQAEPNEVKKTLSHIPLANEFKPKPEEIMNLGLGKFVLASRNLKTQVFVQSWWVSDEDAHDVAIKKITIHELPDKPKIVMRPVKEEPIEKPTQSNNELDEIKKLIDDMKSHNAKFELTDKIIDIIVEKVIKKIPQSSGGVSYTVTPLEKIQKDFILEIKERLIQSISALEEKPKKMLKYMEGKQSPVSITELCDKCFGITATGGGNRDNIAKYGNVLINLNILQKVGNNFVPKLKDRITEMLKTQNASDDEIDTLYQHIIMELLS